MNNATILTGFCCLLILGFFAIAAENDDTQPLLGDESDGSRTTPIHVIPLFAENQDGEKGKQIKPDEKKQLPFSTRITCGECHTYDTIKHGWHFNAVDSNIPAGRPGQPWIYFNSKTFTQIPLSYRQWPGTYKPEQFGMSEFQFTIFSGRHMPGGGSGEVKATIIDDIGRQMVSGNLEINCLACHNAHYGHDMGSVTGYSVQVSSRENFRWAAAASSEIADVTGTAKDLEVFYDPFLDSDIQVNYKKEAFNENDEVLLHIVREVPNDRCSFCHSNLYQDSNLKTEKWTQDEDIHLSAGLKCVDCHRNGLDHNIIRGYPEEESFSDNPLVSSSTCEGCHISQGQEELPEAGRFGAPIATHPGIPAVHFDKLTCTACHSGPWPEQEAVYTKTSRAHSLGIPDVKKEPDVLPHILSPVLAKQQWIITGEGDSEEVIEGEKIAPYKILWPSFWGILDSNGVTPVYKDVVDKVVSGMFDNIELTYRDSWREITDEMIIEAITALTKSVEGQVVFISGGKLYSLDESGQLNEQEHPAAEPYLWPVAHNVRPAAQALGVRYCTDCHATDSPVFFGDVKIDSPVEDTWDSSREMIEFQKNSRFYTRVFAFSFVFRPWMKLICICCCAVIAGVLLLYALRALSCIAKAFGKGN